MTATYNYLLAKWLDEKLNPLSTNKYTITDTLFFAKQFKELSFDVDDIMISYDVTTLFTNVPLDYTISLLVDKAFKDNRFCLTHGLNISKEVLSELLRISTKEQLLQLNDNLYEQIDGVAMGSPLGPLLATR